MTQLKCAANIEVTESLLDTNENKSLLLALVSCYPHIIQTVYPHYHNYHTRSFPWHIPGTVPSINRRGYTSSFSHSLTDTSLFNSSGRVGSPSSSSTSLQIDKKSMVVNQISAFKGAGLAIFSCPISPESLALDRRSKSGLTGSGSLSKSSNAFRVELERRLFPNSNCSD